MSTLTLHQKLVAMVESYEVKDGNTLKYTAKKKIITAGADFDVFDANGNQVALIDQKVLNMVKTYDISIYGQPCGTVKKKVPALTKDMSYDARGWKLNGDAFGINFMFTDAQKNVYATVKKKLVALGDTYEINITNPQDELLVVVLTIILDETFHSKRS